MNALRHLIDWKFWRDEDIRHVLELARTVKHNRRDFETHMRGQTLVMLFQKTSTRTRVSFEAGMTELGGHAINLDWRASNFTLSKVRFETQYLSRNAAMIMARLKDNADILEMEQAASVPIINGCCDLYHPCQALADMLTIAEYRTGNPEGAKLTYIGVYNNVVNSLVSIAAALGVRLTLVCPIRDGERWIWNPASACWMRACSPRLQMRPWQFPMLTMCTPIPGWIWSISTIPSTSKRSNDAAT